MFRGFGGLGNVLAGFCKRGCIGLFRDVTFCWWSALLALARVHFGLFCVSRLYRAR